MDQDGKIVVTKKGINHTLTAALHRVGDWVALASSGVVVLFAQDFSEGQLRVAWIALTLGLLVSAWLFPSMSVYQRWRGETRAKELYTVTIAWSVVFFILAAFLWILGFNADNYRQFLLLWGLFGGVSLVFVRFFIRKYLNHVRSKGGNLRNIVIVGNDKHTEGVIQRLKKEAWTGFNVVGYFGDVELSNVESTKIGGFEDIGRFLEENPELDQLWVAMPLSDERMIEKLLSQVKFSTINIRYVPDISGFMLINHSISEVAQMPVVNLTASPLQGWNYLVKEIEDKILSGIILACISPIMICLAIGVKLSSPGPIFFRQERVSWNGKTFDMLKFRSMTMAVEEDNNPEWGGAKSSAKAARVTKLGAFIRKTSLDELPQFINVLKGDMSIVGPRPERTVFVDQFKHEIHGYMQKHLMKAGITGWAQVNGWRGDTDLQKRVEFDLHYINNWSFWFDIKIIFLTLFKGFVHKNSG